MRNLKVWLFKFKGRKNTVYEGGIYDVLIKYPDNYPD